jgi:hypothetical protein
MDKINHQYPTVKRLKAVPVKTLGLIIVGLIFIMGLSSCRTTQAVSGHAKSKALAENLYPDKKPSVAHVQSSPADSAKPAVQHLGLNSIERMQPSGEYSVYVLKNNKWENAGILTCDRFLRDQSMDLSPFLSAKEPVKIRLVEKGGGAAHIDAVLLGGVPPAKITGGQNAGFLKKISKRDFDVMDAFGKTFEITFPATEKDKTLCLTARIEPEIISKTPFQFPTKNLFREIDENSRFYTYKLGSQKSGSTQNAGLKAKEQPFFKEYCSTGSGHPSGFTYGWVRNDDENLYVKIDFTPDNTMDGDKDYARLYVKTDQGLKTFTLSEPDTRWGRADFTHTDKAEYEHKVYNFQIPLKELNAKNTEKGNELLLAFSAYGTAYPKGYEPVTAYDSADNYYLVVYEDSPWSGLSRIWAQVINPDGSPVAPAEQIFHEVQYNGNIDIAYDSINDGFLVVWEHYPGLGGISDIYGMWVTVDGSGSISHGFQFFVNCDPETGDQRNPAIAYDSANQNFLVVWEDERDSGTTGTDIYGQIVPSCSSGPDTCSIARCGIEPHLNTDKLISHGWFQIEDQVNPAVAYDSVRGEYLVVWEYNFDYNVADPSEPTEYDPYPSIFGQFVDVAGDHIYGENFPVSFDWYDGSTTPVTIIPHQQNKPSIGYDHYNRSFLITWDDDRNIGTTGTDIYAQRVFITYSWLIYFTNQGLGGETGGGPGGEDVYIRGLQDDFVISEAADDQLNSALTYDSTCQYFLVVWDDYRNDATTLSDIYGQPVHVVRFGLPILGQSVAVTTAADNQTNPSVAYNILDQNFFSVFETDPGTANDIAFTTFPSEFDGDGMDCDWEFTHGLNPYADDADLDPDEDNLTNFQEFLDGSDPNKNESGYPDFDGVDYEDDNCPERWNIMRLYELGKSREECATTTFGIQVGDLWQPDYDCDGIGNECDPDADADGYIDFIEFNGDDCNDENETIYPGAGGCPESGISGVQPAGKGKDKTDDGDGVDDATEDNCVGDNNPKVEYVPYTSEYVLGTSIDDCAITQNLLDEDNMWQPDYDCDGYGDACDTCLMLDIGEDQTIPVWYKDEDGDTYSTGDWVQDCIQPAGYRPESELTPGYDCVDSLESPNLPPNATKLPEDINPGADEEKGNDIDDDCNPETSDNFGDYTIAIKNMSPAGHDSWDPKPGDTITVEFTVIHPDGVTEITSVPNEYGDSLTDDYQFSLADFSPPLQSNPTNYPGKYHNDPTDDGVEDFTHDLQYSPNSIQLVCNDYGAWIAVHVQVPLERGDGSPVLAQGDFTFPKDRDRDGLGDFWEYDEDFNPNEIDLNPIDDLENDGIKVKDEYRGCMWGRTTEVEPDGVVYDTPAYVPEGGPSGTLSHIRTRPDERDLFIKFDDKVDDSDEGFDNAWPFAIGEAFHNLQPSVAVHALGKSLADSLPEGSDEYNIDVVTVILDPETYNSILPGNEGYEEGFLSPHIQKLQEMSWTFGVPAISPYGNADEYAPHCKLFKKTIDAYFTDRPYCDYTTLDNGGNKKVQADWICNDGTYEDPCWECIEGQGNGQLEWGDLCEDVNDNGVIDGSVNNNENKSKNKNASGKGILDGDFLVRNLYDNPVYDYFSGIAYAGPDIDDDLNVDDFDYRFQLSPFDYDRNGMMELPTYFTTGAIIDLYDNSRAQAIKMFITHEVGHATGINFHTQKDECTMNNVSNNLVRDNHFDPDTAGAVVSIHNN